MQNYDRDHTKLPQIEIFMNENAQDSVNYSSACPFADSSSISTSEVLNFKIAALSWNKINKDSTINDFFVELFKQEPDIQKLFVSLNMKVQQHAFRNCMTKLFSSSLNRSIPMLTSLGLRHIK